MADMILMEKRKAALDKAVVELGEIFDTVQIITTHDDDNEVTMVMMKGCGNAYARLGAVQDHLVRMQEEARIQVREGRQREL